MRHQDRELRGRARSASAQNAFRNALIGEPTAGSRPFDPGSDRKTLQLCRQIHRALIMAVGDELPGNLSVESVEPMGTASQMLVRVIVSEPTPEALAEAIDQLNRRAAPLRALVCRSIHRKRAPALNFIAMPCEIGGDAGGDS